MTLTIGSIFRRPKRTLSQKTLNVQDNRKCEKCQRFRLIRLQSLGNLFFGDSAFFDDTPIGFGDVNGG